jgi:D-xylose transport system permease protein
VRESTLHIVLSLLWAFFNTQTDGLFLTQRNLILLALQTSIVSLAAISAVMLIVTRNFDLSVGSAVALVGVVLATLTVRMGVNPLVATLAALACGLAMGAWNGLWVTRWKVTSFIVTLAGMLYFRGASMVITSGETVAPLPEVFSEFAAGFLPPAASILLLLAAFGAFATLQWRDAVRARQLEVIESVSAELQRVLALPLILTLAAVWIASWQGVPYLILLVVACAILAEAFMQRSTYGVKLYAIGGNPEAAKLSGIRIERTVFINFLVAGLFYGITGIALTSRVSGAVAGSAGLFLELDAIAAAIIGGTALTGGKGRVFGALVGALLMGSLNNGMSLMNVPTFYQDTARGVVLLLAVAADQFSRKRARA